MPQLVTSSASIQTIEAERTNVDYLEGIPTGPGSLATIQVGR